MESIWYIIVDQQGEEIYTSNIREAKTAFRSGGIVTIVHESVMYVENAVVSTRVFIDMKEDE